MNIHRRIPSNNNSCVPCLVNLVKERPLKTFLFRPLDKFKFMYGFILQSSFITSISDFFKLCFRPCFCLRWLCNVQCIVVFFYYYSYFTSRCCSHRVLFLSAGAFFLKFTVLLLLLHKILRGQAAHKELCYLFREHFYCLFIQPPKMGSTSRIHQHTAPQKGVRL